MPRIRPLSAKPPSAKPQVLPQVLPPGEAERRDICIQALALAQRADAAGLSMVAYLLDMAALEADAQRANRRPSGAGPK